MALIRQTPEESEEIKKPEALVRFDPSSGVRPSLYPPTWTAQWGPVMGFISHLDRFIPIE